MQENKARNPMIFNDESLTTNAKIKVIGVGGGGSNAVNQMINDHSDLVEYIVCNTDCQALSHSKCPNKYVLGKNVTGGLGAGGNPSRGKEAAEDSYSDIQLLVQDADMVFLACGEGGGTGTGAAPVIARAAKEQGSLVLAIVTRPFNFEGKTRKLNAMQGISELKKNVDSIIVVSNDKLVFNNGKRSLKDAFKDADEVLARAVKTITDMILVHGTINLDFADVKSTLAGKGISLIGIGTGTGKEKAIDAARNAINSPLLEASIKGAQTMMMNFTIGEDTTLEDIQYAVDFIHEASGNEPNIIFGVMCDDSYVDKVTIAIIATDFKNDVMFNTDDQHLVDITGHSKAEEKKTLSNTEKEMEKEQDSSPLPDYLRNLFNKKTVEAETKKEEPDVNEAIPVEPDIPVEPEDEPAPVKKEEPASEPEERKEDSSSEEDEDDTILIPIDED